MVTPRDEVDDAKCEIEASGWGNIVVFGSFKGNAINFSVGQSSQIMDVRYGDDEENAVANTVLGSSSLLQPKAHLRIDPPRLSS